MVACKQGNSFAGLKLDIPLDSVCNEGISRSWFFAGGDVVITFV